MMYIWRQIKVEEVYLVSSYCETKRTLADAILHKYNKVTVLTGRWGIGKTYLVEQISENAECKDVFKNCVYASMLGLSSLSDLRTKLAASLVSGYAGRMPALNSLRDNKYVDRSAGLIEMGISTVFKKFLGSSISDAISVGLPKLLGGRLVILDDIERKNGSLNITEVIGFINEYSEMYDCKFLLLMNEDELADKELWEKYFEKVVDRKIGLAPDIDDLFEIASADYIGNYIDKSKDEIKGYEVDSIRIIRKVLSLADKLFRGFFEEDDNFIGDFVFSVVTIGVLHYKGARGAFSLESLIASNGDLNEEMFGLQVKYSGESSIRFNYNSIVGQATYNLLSKGLINLKDLTNEAIRLRFKQRQEEVTESVRGLVWKIKKSKKCPSKEEVLEVIGSLKINPDTLSPDLVTDLYNQLCSIGLSHEAGKIIDVWVEYYERNSSVKLIGNSIEQIESNNYHDKIIQAEKVKFNNEPDKYSLFGAITRLSNGDELSEFDIERIFITNPNEYFHEMKYNLEGRNLISFIDSNFKIGKLKEDEACMLSYSTFYAACEKVFDLSEDESLQELSQTLKVKFIEWGVDLPSD